MTGTRFEVLSPTGKFSDPVDFPLYPQHEPDKFDVLVFADPQYGNVNGLRNLCCSMLDGLIGFDAVFGVSLGDIVFDNLDMFAPTNRSIAAIGMPWRNVTGNHDIDRKAINNKDARGGWYRTYGPPYYSSGTWVHGGIINGGSHVLKAPSIEDWVLLINKIN